MRSTKSIRRDIQIYVLLSALALGFAIFFAIACFVYLTFNNAMLGLVFLVLAAVCIGKTASYIFEHREALVAQYAGSNPAIEFKNR